MQASTSWDDVAFSSTERDRHLGIRPVSQLNTWPVVSPVNASRLPSRAEPRASLGGRGGWPGLPRGGLSPPILCQLSWRTPLRVIQLECPDTTFLERPQCPHTGRAGLIHRI